MSKRFIFECTSLKEITVNENNKNYSSSSGILFNKNKTELICFPSSNSSTHYSIPSTVTSLRTGAFFSCENLDTITLSARLQTIGEGTFFGCSSLEIMYIPESVTAIDPTAFYNDTDLTLGVWFGSYGYDYAKAQNIPYILLDSVLLGDANGDGNVNISDVTDIQRVVAEMDTFDDLRQKAADINGDGVVTIDDATFLQTYLAEFGTAYPIGEVV